MQQKGNSKYPSTFDKHEAGRYPIKMAGIDEFFIDLAASFANIKTILDGLTWSQAQPARWELNALKQKISNSLSDVKNCLECGQIGLLEKLDGLNLDIDIFEEIWQDFHSFLLQAQDVLLKLHKRLELWEKLLYLVLFFSFFSEFPNSFRHLCTTMPWTIWPALVVLWGVCWMFYGPGDGSFGELTGLVGDEYIFELSSSNCVYLS